MQNKEELIKILKKLYASKFDICFGIYANELVNMGKMTISNIQNILSNPEKLNDISETTLLLLYKPLSEYKGIDVPSSDKYFTREEEYEASSLIQKKINTGLPVRFKILAKLTDNENYLICLSVQEINALKEAGIIRWVQEMQRESVVTKISENEFISHIRYDDKRARAIGESISKGDFFPNTLRWHIVTDDCEYDIEDDRVILKSGYIAEIDGQHRDKGSEYALRELPDIIMNMPIVLTVGSKATAQRIINQDEKRAPIDKNVVAGYKASSGNSILKMMIGNEDIDDIYKFCDTVQGIQTGSGFVLKSVLSEAIEKYYCEKRMSRNAERQTAKWLVDFFDELSEIFYDEFENFRSSRNKNLKADYKSFEAYVYISSKLKGRSDWQNELRRILNAIDFDKSNKKLNSVKYLNRILKEVNIVG